MTRRSTFLALCLSLVIGTGVGAQRAQADVSDVIRGSSFPRGYAELSASFDASVTPQLIALLNSDREEEHWIRVAGMLGVVGDERAVDALIEFVGRPVDALRLSQAHNDARNEAIRALGFLVHRTGNERALHYLIAGLTPSAWRQRNVQGVAPWMNTYAEYDVYLSTWALTGLSVSGHPGAGQAIRSLQLSPSPEQARLRDGLDSTLEQRLEVHELVATRGVAGMFEHYETRRRLRAEREMEEAQRLRQEMGAGQILGEEH